jgi:hypothetical protein
MNTMFDFSPPPDDADAGDVMKWMIAVMDRDDTSLHFVSSVLSNFLKYNGITEKQAAGVEKIYSRVLAEFKRGVLHIQTGGAPAGGGPTNVTHIGSRRSRA